MKKYTLYFNGAENEFPDVLNSIGPHYEIPNKQCLSFKSIQGATVSWWPSTGRCHVQGPNTVRQTHYKKLSTAIGKHAKSSLLALPRPVQVAADRQQAS